MIANLFLSVLFSLTSANATSPMRFKVLYRCVPVDAKGEVVRGSTYSLKVYQNLSLQKTQMSLVVGARPMLVLIEDVKPVFQKNLLFTNADQTATLSIETSDRNPAAGGFKSTLTARSAQIPKNYRCAQVNY